MSTYDSASLTYDATTTTYDGAGTQLAIPYLVVEIAFDDGPYVASPTWTDVSSYVRAASTRRGRNDDLATFTGTASLTLSNRDRRFDPFYTSGPYYGKLLPRRQIRVRAIVGSSTYPVFRGYIAGWPVTYTDAGKDSTVTIECFDALSLLSTEDTPFEWYDWYIRQTASPTNYYRLDDPVGATIVDSLGGLNIPYENYIGLYPAYFQKESNAAPGLVGGGAAFTNSRYTVTAATTGTSSGGSVNMWFRRTNTSNNSSGFACYSTNCSVAVNYNANALQIDVYDGFRTARFVSTATNFDTTDWHHLSINITPTTLGTMWLDGAQLDGAYTWPSGGVQFLNTPRLAPLQNISFIGFGAFQSVSIHGETVGLATAQNMYAYGAGYFNETSSARVTKLIGNSSFPTGLVSTPASPAATLSNITNEADLNSELSTVNASEGGELYVDKSGVVTMTARNTQNTAARSVTTQAAFTDTGASLKYGTTLTIAYDADSIRNEFTYTASDGTISVEDATSIATYSKNSASITTQLSSKTDATTLANLKLSYFDAPVPAVSPLLVSVTRSTTDWQDLLDLELLDQITVTRTPSTGNAVEVRMLVNAVQHDITPGDWNMTVTGSARYSNWFTVDTDYLDGDRLIV